MIAELRGGISGSGQLGGSPAGVPASGRGNILRRSAGTHGDERSPSAV
jgi:hypothetical protein